MSSTVLETTPKKVDNECPRCNYEMLEERPACFFCTNCGGKQTCEDL